MIKSEIKAGHLKIYIDDVLHLSIDLFKVVAIQSYITAHFWNIDIYCKDNVVVDLEYDSFEKWNNIIKELDKINL